MTLIVRLLLLINTTFNFILFLLFTYFFIINNINFKFLGNLSKIQDNKSLMYKIKKYYFNYCVIVTRKFRSKFEFYFEE